MKGSSRGHSMTVGDRRPGGPSFRAELWRWAALLWAAGTALGCGGDADEPRCIGGLCGPLPRPCVEGLQTFASGSTRPAGDGCNTCTCVDGGWSCTARGCVGDACVYGGQVRSDGSSFLAEDGCNTCTCSDGAVACTERGCVPQPCSYGGRQLLSGQSTPASDGCNTCSCVDGELMCTQIGCRGGCYGNDECGPSQYCAFPVSACVTYGLAAGGADVETEEQRDPARRAPLPPGECQERPRVCNTEPAPVCACDGQTYNSACAAASLGLNLASEGACPEGG